jgi:hypothetical protein
MSYLLVSSPEIAYVMCRPFRIWGMLHSWFAPSASSPILPFRRFGCNYGGMLEYILNAIVSWQCHQMLAKMAKRHVSSLTSRPKCHNHNCPLPTGWLSAKNILCRQVFLSTAGYSCTVGKEFFTDSR